MNTKEQILQTALDLFSRRGYEAVSVNDIAAEIGISKGALYKHFKNKRDIFDSIVRRMDDQIRADFESFSVPRSLFNDMPASFGGSALESICAYTLFRFVYWTEDDFASRFRRMLFIEQFSDRAMRELFKEYLVQGPLTYLENEFNTIYGASVFGCTPKDLALEFYSPVFMLMAAFDSENAESSGKALKEHIERFVRKLASVTNEDDTSAVYPLSEKYSAPGFMKMLSGPNPVKLCEELLTDAKLRPGSLILNLGIDTKLLSLFLAKEYGVQVYAADPGCSTEEYQQFYRDSGLSPDRVRVFRSDPVSLPFKKNIFDAVVSINSYQYFGINKDYLDTRLLPYVKPGGYVYISIPGMKKDCHDQIPDELLLSWSPEQLAFIHDVEYWKNVFSDITGAQIVSIREMTSKREVWSDWLMQDNMYALSERKAIEAGAGKYLNFIEIILVKNSKAKLSG